MKEKTTKWWKKLSTFQIVCIVLTIILFVAIIIQIGVIINLKNRTDDTKRKNEEIAQEAKIEDLNFWQQNYLNNIRFIQIN